MNATTVLANMTMSTSTAAMTTLYNVTAESAVNYTTTAAFTTGGVAPSASSDTTQISPLVTGTGTGSTASVNPTSSVTRSISATSNLLFEEALTNFSFSMYEALDKTSNEFLSPFSISAALLLLALGTDGTTNSQIINSLFENDQPESIKMGYKILSDKLASRTNKNNTLTVANKLFPSSTFKLLQSFNDDALEYFGGDAQQLDYVKNAEASRVTINDWISSQTNSKIKNMLQKNSLGPDTVAVLVNAIYFKGKWKTPFDRKLTTKRNFLVKQNVQRQVDMMSGKFDALSGEDLTLDCKFLKLPYMGEEMSMVIVLPNDGNGLSLLETKLTVDKFRKLFANAQKQETVIKIPKFIMEAEYNLRPVFEAIGITEIFDQKTANFTNMVPDDSPDVYVSDARHKAFIEVSEEGTEAAASSSMTISLMSLRPPPFEFIADHPFIFFIQDDITGTILFVGRFADP